jgi:hypothetical protein
MKTKYPHFNQLDSHTGMSRNFIIDDFWNFFHLLNILLV